MSFLRNRRALSLAVLLTAGVLVGTALPQANASIQHPRVVSDNPADFTPHVLDDAATVANAAVHAFHQVGGTMYAGGAFGKVRNVNQSATHRRYNLMSFNATTGLLTGFAPVINGPVTAITSSGTSVYVAGSFTTVNGVARRGIVKLDGATGAVDPNFNAALPYGKVNDARIVGGRLYLAGTFPKGLIAAYPTTGKDGFYVNLPVAGTLASNAGPTVVDKLAVSPHGAYLVGIGNFTSIGGQRRYRAFMLTLWATRASVNAWRYVPLERMCYSINAPGYLTDVDFTWDGSFFVFTATGGPPMAYSHIGTSICDAAARFNTLVTAPTRPVWINYTGGDTLTSVAVTGPAVYVQGHQRWLNNPYGHNSAGPGAVSRPGIGAIHPVTGLALAWNPGKEGGIGGKDLYATTAGLWVGSDTNFIHGEFHPSLALMPF